MKTLIIVDVQQDLYSKDGNAYVNGAETVVPNIVKYIEEHKSEISDVIFTLDWHPNVPAAFVEKDRTSVPRHCVQYTSGAGVSSELVETCAIYQKTAKFFIKGNTVPHIENGAFAKIGRYETICDDEKIAVNNIKGDCSIIFGTDNIVICGLAGDGAVLETVKNLVNSKSCKSIELLESGVASNDRTNETIKDYCLSHKVNII